MKGTSKLHNKMRIRKQHVLFSQNGVEIKLKPIDQQKSDDSNG
jgi:hypothetical protein